MVEYIFKKEFDYEKADGSPNTRKFPADSTRATFYLVKDGWNDHNYYTYSRIFFTFPSNNIPIGYPSVIDLGYIRIGKMNQKEKENVFNELPNNFHELENNHFSLSLNIKYYETIIELDDLDIIDSDSYFNSTKDIAYKIENLGDYIELYPTYESLVFDPERVRLQPRRPANVINNSLIRDNKDDLLIKKLHNIANKKGLFSRYKLEIHADKYSPLTLTSFREEKKIDRILNKNIYCLIGANGCGKTTLLQNIFKEIDKPGSASLEIYNNLIENDDILEKPKVFYMSFSPFDTDLTDYIKPTNYFGNQIKLLKKDEIDPDLPDRILEAIRSTPGQHLTLKDTWFIDFIDSINLIIENKLFPKWYELLSRVIPGYEKYSDALSSLLNDQKTDNSHYSTFYDLIHEQSSGISYMLLSLTRIYSIKDDNCLILIDEPENHLQPPMLSKFMDALSFICTNKNCISLIATHSPVTVQELDKDNVFIMTKNIDNYVSLTHPLENTFGENIGKLNRKIFNYELAESGYYRKINKFINSLHDDQLMNEFYEHLGLEGRMLMDSKKFMVEINND